MVAGHPELSIQVGDVVVIRNTADAPNLATRPRSPTRVAEELQLRSEAARSDLLRRAEEGQPDTSRRQNQPAARVGCVESTLLRGRRSWGTLDESHKCGTSRHPRGRASFSPQKRSRLGRVPRDSGAGDDPRGETEMHPGSARTIEASAIIRSPSLGVHASFAIHDEFVPPAF